jgi:hypothetical protein
MTIKQQNDVGDEGAKNKPPEDFCNWWYPSRIDTTTGASVGGHCDAERVWARHETGRWLHRTFGMAAITAWMIPRYRNEYKTWVKNGKPKRVNEFTSTIASTEKQKEFWRGVREGLRPLNEGPIDFLTTTNEGANNEKT